MVSFWVSSFYGGAGPTRGTRADSTRGAHDLQDSEHRHLGDSSSDRSEDEVDRAGGGGLALDLGRLLEFTRWGSIPKKQAPSPSLLSSLSHDCTPPRPNTFSQVLDRLGKGAGMYDTCER